MKATTRTLSALFVAVAVLTLGNGLFGILLALRMTVEQQPAWATGLVLGVYFAGFIPATLYGRGVIARVGHIRAFAAFAAIAAAAVLALPIATGLWAWVLLRAVIGGCLAILFMTVESWLNARTENRLRGRVLGLYQAAIFVSVSTAQLLVGFGDPTSFVLFSAVAMLYALSLVPLALTRAEPPALSAPTRLRLGQLIRLSPLAVAVAMGAGVINAAFQNMGPVFALGVGMSTLEAGRFMAMGVLSGLVMQWPFGWLSDRFDRRHVVAGIAISASVAALALAVGALLGASQWLFVLAAAFGGFSFALYPQAVAHANDYAEPHTLVSMSAGLLLANGLGAMASPLVAGLAIDAFGPPALFVMIGVVSGALGAFAIYRMGRRDPKPVAQQTPFTPVPDTTPEAAALDPRAEARAAPETETAL